VLLILEDIFEQKRHKTPPAVRRCVVDVFKERGVSGREGLDSAFAICIKSQQKAGQMKGGGQTKKGKKRSKHFAGKKDMAAYDREFEKILADVSGSKKEASDSPTRAAVKDLKHTEPKGRVIDKQKGSDLWHGMFPKKKGRRDRIKKKLKSLKELLPRLRDGTAG